MVAGRRKETMEEIYKDIKGFEGYYQISNFGNVKSFHAGKCLILRSLCGGWYRSLWLCKDGVKKTYRIHRLVADTFIPNPLGLPEVNHIDMNKENNRVDNLEWVTRKQNEVHAIKNNPGIIAGMNKYNKNRRKAVLQISLSGDYLNAFDSALDASIETGVCARNIHQVANHTEYKPGLVRSQAGGYVWKFVRLEKVHAVKRI